MTIPRIRSESPAFDLHHPEVAAIELDQNLGERRNGFSDNPDVDGRDEMLRSKREDER